MEFFKPFEAKAHREVYQSESPHLELSIGTYRVFPPHLHDLLEVGYLPSDLTQLAQSLLPKPDPSKVKPAPIEVDTKIIRPTLQKLVLPDLEEEQPMTQLDAHLVLQLITGKLEVPNHSHFRLLVQLALRRMVQAYQSPPSTWGCLQFVQNKIVSFDLDFAASLFLDEYQNQQLEIQMQRDQLFASLVGVKAASR